MAIWVANDNNARDDNFNLFIDNRSLGQLRLETDDCNGHLIMNTKYSQFSKNQIAYHPDVTSRISGCLPSFQNDTSSRLLFNSNVPLTRENNQYSINLQNINPILMVILGKYIAFKFAHMKMMVAQFCVGY